LHFERELEMFLSNLATTGMTECVPPRRRRGPKTDVIENPVEKYVWLDEITTSSLPAQVKKRPLESESEPESQQRRKCYHLKGHIQFGLKRQSRCYSAGTYRSLKYAMADQRRFVEELEKTRTKGAKISFK
jgi:hypothetical protein